MVFQWVVRVGQSLPTRCGLNGAARELVLLVQIVVKADKTTMFREIPSDSRFYGVGVYLPGSDINGVVCGSSHSNSRFLCTANRGPLSGQPHKVPSHGPPTKRCCGCVYDTLSTSRRTNAERSSTRQRESRPPFDLLPQCRAMM